MTELIYHITTESAADEAAELGTYEHPSLKTEGFIHCSDLDQLLIPANERYQGQSGLVLLVVRTDVVSDALVYEDTYGSGTEFPHVYTPIHWSAVADVVSFPCGPNGRFEIPTTLLSERGD